MIFSSPAMVHFMRICSVVRILDFKIVDFFTMELEGFDGLSEFGKANTHIKNSVLARVWVYCWSFKPVLSVK